LVRNPEVKRQLGRPRLRWVDNIRMDLLEIWWGVWTGLVWVRIGTGGVESSCELGNESWSSVKCWKTIKWLHKWWPLEYCSAPYSQSVS
jgi:hypothetical protein